MPTLNAPSIPIYLDNAASTPILDEVLRDMLPYLKEHYGNPSSLHMFGRTTMRAIQKARRSVSSLIGCKENEVIFTSGGTEANNLAVKGIAESVRLRNPEKDHIIASSIEHESILEPFRYLEKNGFDVTYLPVTKRAEIEARSLRKAMKPGRTAFASIMFCNNEVGTIQPIRELACIVHKDEGLFHCDAVQAVGKIPIDVNYLGVDLLSMSSHKINGPKGVGALYARNGLKLPTFTHGGGQEFALRSGTENVAGIVGFGKACELARKRLLIYQTEVLALREYLVRRVLGEIPNCRLNGSTDNRIANNAHFTFFGIKGEDLIMKLDEMGVAASTGSACSSRHLRSSHVLKAMKFSHLELSGSLRLTVGTQNTKEEMDQVVSILSKVVDELRRVSPFELAVPQSEASKPL